MGSSSSSSRLWQRGATTVTIPLLCDALPSWPYDLIVVLYSYTRINYRHYLCIGGRNATQAMGGPLGSGGGTAANGTNGGNGKGKTSDRCDIWSLALHMATNPVQALLYHGHESLNRHSLILSLSWYEGLYPPNPHYGVGPRHTTDTPFLPPLATPATIEDIQPSPTSHTVGQHDMISWRLPTPRRWPTAALLDDGNILMITGGHSETTTHGTALATVDALCMMSSTWLPSRRIPHMITPRYDACSGVLDDGRWIVAGGNVTHRGHRHATFTVECYDPYKNCWTRLPGMITARAGASSCVVNGLFYVFGGATSNQALTMPDCERYNSELDKWTKIADMPSQRGHCAIVVYQGDIYLLGGERYLYGGSGASENTVYRYNIHDNRWYTCSWRLPPAFTKDHIVHAIIEDHTLLVWDTSGSQVWSLDMTHANDAGTDTPAGLCVITTSPLPPSAPADSTVPPPLPSPSPSSWHSWPAMLCDRSTSCIVRCN